MLKLKDVQNTKTLLTLLVTKTVFFIGLMNPFIISQLNVPEIIQQRPLYGCCTEWAHEWGRFGGSFQWSHKEQGFLLCVIKTGINTV